MRYLIVIVSVLLASCAQQYAEAVIHDHHSSPTEIYHALVDTDYDRYLIYDDSEIIVSEESAEDIRVISSTYDKWHGGKVMIRHNHQYDQKERAVKVRELLVAFGVSSDDIHDYDIREDLLHLDGVLQLSMQIEPSNLGYAKGP